MHNRKASNMLKKSFQIQIKTVERTYGISEVVW